METNNELPGTSTKPFQCPSCPKSYLHKKSLSYHTLSTHVKDELKSYNCKECLERKQINKLFATQQLLNVHLKTAHGPPAFRNDRNYPALPCNSCEKSFVRKQSLKEHILNKHMGDECKTFSCSKCLHGKQVAKSFATQAILDKHMRRAHGSHRFKCQVCFKTFYQSSNFRKHVRVHSNNSRKNYKCELCSKTYYSAPELHTHMLRVHKQKRENVKYFKCELCTLEFVSRFNLEAHVVAKHVVDKPFECHVCSKTFIDRQYLGRHMKLHDTCIKYFCDICSKGFKRKPSFNQHLGVEHKRFFYCIKCLRSFGNKPEFDAHIYDSEQELKCYICQETMDSECNLKIHTDSHVKGIKTENTGETKTQNETKLMLETAKLFKPEPALNMVQLFECELCSKTFDRKAYFKAHRAQVHANAEWKCNVKHCCRSFKQFSELIRHKVTHSETKEFVCHICQKAFHFSKGLSDHEQIHLDKKKHECEQCPKSYPTLFGLRVHVANNHGGPRPFKCPKNNCNTAWPTKFALKEHLISHETERLYKCHICTKPTDFKTLKSLTYHERQVHSQAKKIAKKNWNKPENKSDEAFVFVCNLFSHCSFQTVNEKAMAIHYNQQHHLPKVLLVNNNC